MSFTKILVTSKIFQYQLCICKKKIMVKHLNGVLSMREMCNSLGAQHGFEMKRGPERRQIHLDENIFLDYKT
jgi:hypothetical protein